MKNVMVSFYFLAGLLAVAGSTIALWYVRYGGRFSEIGEPLELYVIGLMGFPAAFWLLRRAMRMSAPNAEEILKSDPRPPVLYLRSFSDDDLTTPLPEVVRRQSFMLLVPDPRLEDSLAVLNALGPLVAIGRPGEALPESGAYRLYVADDEWKERVLKIMAGCRLVVMLGHTTTNGIHWEIEQATTRLRPDQLIILFPFGGEDLETRESKYRAFRCSAGKYFSAPLPETIGTGNILCFDSGWRGIWLGREVEPTNTGCDQDLLTLLRLYIPGYSPPGLIAAFRSAPPARRAAGLALFAVLFAMLLALLAWGYSEIAAIHAS